MHERSILRGCEGRLARRAWRNEYRRPHRPRARVDSGAPPRSGVSRTGRGELGEGQGIGARGRRANGRARPRALVDVSRTGRGEFGEGQEIGARGRRAHSRPRPRALVGVIRAGRGQYGEERGIGARGGSVRNRPRRRRPRNVRRLLSDVGRGCARRSDKRALIGVRRGRSRRGVRIHQIRPSERNRSRTGGVRHAELSQIPRGSFGAPCRRREKNG